MASGNGYEVWPSDGFEYISADGYERNIIDGFELDGCGANVMDTNFMDSNLR